MMRNTEFTDEQKQYLEGFAAGSGIIRSLPLAVLPHANGKATWGATLGIADSAKPHGGGDEKPIGPDALGRAAQDRFLEAGKTLSAEEQAKRKLHGLDTWDAVVAHARDGKFPKGTDV